MLYSKTIRVTLQKVNGLWLNTKYIEGCKDITSFALVEINKIIQNAVECRLGISNCLGSSTIWTNL